LDALIFDGGNDGDVGGAGAQGFGALRRNGESEIVFAAQGAVGEAPDERSGVEILNDGDAQFGQVGGSRGNRKSIAERGFGDGRAHGRKKLSICTETVESVNDRHTWRVIGNWTVLTSGKTSSKMGRWPPAPCVGTKRVRKALIRKRLRVARRYKGAQGEEDKGIK
jgi:hypothetical protein